MQGELYKDIGCLQMLSSMFALQFVSFSLPSHSTEGIQDY